MTSGTGVKDDRTVLVTGASGSMGHEAFLELWRRRDRYRVVLLLLPDRHGKRMFRPYEEQAGIRSIRGRGVVESPDGRFRIVWGDLTRYEDVARAIDGVDHVLHPAAFVAPAADHDPARAQRVNLGSMLNIIRAVREQPRGPERITVVSVSSVALYGDRRPPVDLIRTGDPVMPCVFDFYALSKAAAERALVESGIRHWVSLRQSYIAVPDVVSLLDPIMFHQPLEQRIELTTGRDAGRALFRTLDQDRDSGFWQRVYNLSGGPACRVTYLDYLRETMRLLGLGDFRRLMDRDWFCLQNFHDGWFADAHVLQDYLGHWRDSLDDHYDQVRAAAPWFVRLGRLVPAALIRLLVMKRMALRRDGPLYWVRHPDEMPGRVRAFFGTVDRWRQTGGWEQFRYDVPESWLLDHGYDDSRQPDSWTTGDLRQAARFRGGELLSTEYRGNRMDRMSWRCAFGHEFRASPALVLLAGHWCPECQAPPWDYGRLARANLHIGQVYDATCHGQAEARYTEAACLGETC